ncbi:hypothetical protein ABK040_002928 [Willaertia magna]
MLPNIFKRTDRKQSVISRKPRSGSILNQNILKVDFNSSLSTSITELENIVKLPENENENDWLAQHVIDFSENLFILIEGCQLHQVCTEITCPNMQAGKHYEYRWIDKHSKEYKNPTIVNAPTYLTLLFDWIHNQLSNPKIFPIQDENVVNNNYPKKFKDKFVKKIIARLFRVFAHLYHHHSEHFNKVLMMPHLNTLFKHFILFSFEFDLISKDELIPLNELILQLLGDKYQNKLDMTNTYSHFGTLQNIRLSMQRITNK